MSRNVRLNGTAGDTIGAAGSLGQELWPLRRPRLGRGRVYRRVGIVDPLILRPHTAPHDEDQRKLDGGKSKGGFWMVRKHAFDHDGASPSIPRLTSCMIGAWI